MATIRAENEDVLRRASEEAIGEGTLALLDEYFAEDFVAHNPALPDAFEGRE